MTGTLVVVLTFIVAALQLVRSNRAAQPGEPSVAGIHRTAAVVLLVMIIGLFVQVFKEVRSAKRDSERGKMLEAIQKKLDDQGALLNFITTPTRTEISEHARGIQGFLESVGVTGDGENITATLEITNTSDAKNQCVVPERAQARDNVGNLYSNPEITGFPVQVRPDSDDSANGAVVLKPHMSRQVSLHFHGTHVELSSTTLIGIELTLRTCDGEFIRVTLPLCRHYSSQIMATSEHVHKS